MYNKYCPPMQYVPGSKARDTYLPNGKEHDGFLAQNRPPGKRMR